MVERAVGVHEGLPAFAANVFEFRHQLIEIADGKGKQEPILEPIRWSIHAF